MHRSFYKFLPSGCPGVVVLYGFVVEGRRAFFSRIIHHRESDGDIMVIFCPEFRLAAGKKDRFLYVFDFAGSLLHDNLRQCLVV